MGILDNYKKILQNYKTQVIDEVKERVLGTKSEEESENFEETDSNTPPPCPNIIAVYPPTIEGIERVKNTLNEPFDLSFTSIEGENNGMNIDEAIELANQALKTHNLHKYVIFIKVPTGSSTFLNCDGAIFLGADVEDCNHLLVRIAKGSSKFNPFAFKRFLETKNWFSTTRTPNNPETSATNVNEGGNIAVVSLQELYLNSDIFNDSKNYANLALTLLHIIGHNSGITHIELVDREDTGIMTVGNKLASLIAEIGGIKALMNNTKQNSNNASNNPFINKVKKNFSIRSVIPCNNQLRIK
jgi:hypothetical protein